MTARGRGCRLEAASGCVMIEQVSMACLPDYATSPNSGEREDGAVRHVKTNGFSLFRF